MLLKYPCSTSFRLTILVCLHLHFSSCQLLGISIGSHFDTYPNKTQLLLLQYTSRQLKLLNDTNSLHIFLRSSCISQHGTSILNKLGHTVKSFSLNELSNVP